MPVVGFFRTRILNHFHKLSLDAGQQSGGDPGVCIPRSTRTLSLYRWLRMEANCETIRRDIHRTVAGYRRDVHAQFDVLFHTAEFLYLAQ
jgi:hypothetical protein